LRQKAAHIALGLSLLFVLYLVVRQLPFHRWIIDAAKLVHGAGGAGRAADGSGHVPVVALCWCRSSRWSSPCGWLYGMWGAIPLARRGGGQRDRGILVARALAGNAAAQALLERPRARALAELAAEGGIWTVALIRLSPILPFTPATRCSA